MELCLKHDVRVKVVTEGLDFSGPIGNALFILFAALAQLDSDTKSEATRTKLDWMRENLGWECHGSPPHCLSENNVAKAPEVYNMLDRGKSYKYIQAALGISEHSIGKIAKMRGKPLITRKIFASLFNGWQDLPKDELGSIALDDVLRWYEDAKLQTV